MATTLESLRVEYSCDVCGNSFHRDYGYLSDVEEEPEHEECECPTCGCECPDCTCDDEECNDCGCGEDEDEDE